MQSGPWNHKVLVVCSVGHSMDILLVGKSNCISFQLAVFLNIGHLCEQGQYESKMF